MIMPWAEIAAVLFGIATIWFGITKAWPFMFTAAGLLAWLVETQGSFSLG